MPVKTDKALKDDGSVVVVPKNFGAHEKKLAAQAAAADLKSGVTPKKGSEKYTKTDITIDSSPPENRMLSSKKLCILRPEIISVLDFQSINHAKGLSSNRNNWKIFQGRAPQPQPTASQAFTSHCV